jgi:hypothetical protein
MSTTIINRPINPSLDINFVKNYLKVEHNQDDDLIIALTKAAILKAEMEVGWILEPCTINQYFDAFPCCDGCAFVLAYGLNRDITPQVDYAINNDVSGDYSASVHTLFVPIRASFEPAHLYVNGTWPTDIHEVINPIRVTYDTPNLIDSQIQSAILLIIGFLYENREDMPINQTNNPKIRSAQSLLMPYKKY